MNNEKQRTFHIVDENGDVLAKVILIKAFEAFVAGIFVNSDSPMSASESFGDENEMHKVIRDLIFKVSLTGFRDIMEVEEAVVPVVENGEKVKIKKKKKKKEKGKKKKEKGRRKKEEGRRKKTEG